MEAWDSISKVTRYIEDNLENKIKMEDLAEVAFLSPFYFQRLFKRLVGIPVMEYIKFRRMAKVADELTNSEDTILNICMRYGFENHETFSRNFKNFYKMTPTEYRENPVILSHFNKPNIALQYTIIDEDVPIVTDGIVLEVTRRTLEKPKFFAGYIATGELKAPSVDPLVEIWEKVHQTKKDIKDYLPDGKEIGVNLNLASKSKNLKYFAGVELANALVDDTLEKYTLHKGTYLICMFEAENFHTLITDTIYKVYTYMHIWIKNKKLLSKVEPVAIEVYNSSSSDNVYMELWIPIKEG